MKITWRVIAGEELARAEEQWARGDAEETCRRWAVSMCAAARGHDWYLEIDPDDGVSLDCRKCHACTDDVYPDGIDLLTGEFEVRPGYVLTLRSGGVLVNGQDCDEFDRWSGPVTVELHTEKYTSMDWIGYEYDAWIDVAAKHDA